MIVFLHEFNYEYMNDMLHFCSCLNNVPLYIYIHLEASKYSFLGLQLIIVKDKKNEIHKI